MCFVKKCDKCEKKNWAGCGLHLENLFKSIPYKDRCWCYYETDKIEKMIDEAKKKGSSGPFPLHKR